MEKSENQGQDQSLFVNTRCFSYILTKYSTVGARDKNLSWPNVSPAKAGQNNKSDRQPGRQTVGQQTSDPYIGEHIVCWFFGSHVNAASISPQYSCFSFV